MLLFSTIILKNSQNNFSISISSKILFSDLLLQAICFMHFGVQFGASLFLPKNLLSTSSFFRLPFGIFEKFFLDYFLWDLKTFLI